MISETFSAESYFWSCLWQSTIFISAGLLGSFILRHRSARAHQALLLAIIATITVPIISILVKHYELGIFVADPIVIQSQPEDIIIYETAEITSVENIEHKLSTVEKDLTAAIIASEKIKFPLRSVLLYGWLATSLILMFRLVFTFILGVRRLDQSMPLDCNRIEQAVHIAKTKLRIDKDVNLYSNRCVQSPVIWCWKRRPILLLPSSAGLSENRIDWSGILCHELAHYKRRDHISGLLAEFIICIMPWHPLLWWAKSRLISLSEQACDDWVITSGQPCTDYAESLLDLLPSTQIAFVPAAVSSKKGLGGRIRRILQDSCGDPRAGGVWALVVSVMATCLAIGVAFAQTRPAEPFRESKANSDIEQIRYHVLSPSDTNTYKERGQKIRYPIDMEGYTTVTTSDMNRLISALSNIEWSREREQAAITISRMGAGAQAAIPALIERLEDEQWYVRRAVASALASMGPIAEPAVPAITKALTDEEWLVRRVAAEAAAAIGPASKPAVPTLIKLLGDEEWHARRAAAEALAAIGPASASAVPSLIVALDDVEWHVRQRAAEALTAIGTASKPATSRLIAALNDEEWQVRKSAAIAIGAIGPAAAKAIPSLTKKLDDPEWHVRQGSADALEKISVEEKSLRWFP